MKNINRYYKVLATVLDHTENDVKSLFSEDFGGSDYSASCDDALYNFFGDDMIGDFESAGRLEVLLLQVCGATPQNKAIRQLMGGVFTPQLSKVYESLGAAKCQKLAQAMRDNHIRLPKALTQYLKSA